MAGIEKCFACQMQRIHYAKQAFKPIQNVPIVALSGDMRVDSPRAILGVAVDGDVQGRTPVYPEAGLGNQAGFPFLTCR
jgi:hypothetical protein